MGLYVDLTITTSSGSLRRLGSVEIVRLLPLRNPEDPNDETHRYRARRSTAKGTDREAFFDHRYGDGAWTCVEKALGSLDL